MSSQPPRVLAILAVLNPSSMMDVVKPLLALEKRRALRLTVTLEAYLRPSQLRQSDLVVFCRNLEPRYAAVLQQVQAAGIPYIYDLDDDLLDVPAESEVAAYYNQPQRRAHLQAYLRGASLIRVYSSALVQRAAPYNPAVEQVIPPLDWPLLAGCLPAHRSGPLKLVYATSRKEDYLYRIFEPALLNVLQRYPDQAQLTLWGCRPPAFEGLPGVRFFPFDDQYDRFLCRFASQGFDIGLAPLLDDAFHRAKTDNKYREYAACGMAGVYSDVSVYQAVIKDGLTGCLAENTTPAWEATLERLLADPDACRRMGQAALADVRRRYDPEAFLQTWQRQIESALLRRPASSPVVPSGAPALPDEALAPQPPPAGAVQRGLGWLSGGSPGNRWQVARVHARNLWRLYRINRWKRP